MFFRLAKGLADILYPKICLGCKHKLKATSINDVLCLDCWQKIEKNIPPFCLSCGRNLKGKHISKGICPDCIKRRLHFDRAFSPCIYTGILKELILAFKYNHKVYLGSTLSSLMVDFIKEYNLPVDCIDFVIPIPLHKRRLREREFNQAQVLSEFVCKEFKKDMLTDFLIRSRPTRTQTELEPSERLKNVEKSFSVNNGRLLKGKNILLIDDVLTTGATSSEAALTLKNSGCGIVFVLTLAN